MKWKKFETADKRPIADRLFLYKSLSTLIFFLDHLFLVSFFYDYCPLASFFFPGSQQHASEIITYRALFHEWDYGFLFVQSHPDGA